MVVFGWGYWDQIFGGVDACGLAGGVDGGEALGEAGANRRAAIEESAAAGLDLGEDASCHDVTWSQFGVFV